ncbi:Hypothetical predicted protein [Podarcis lilfordi]|nr:Hypothetical predicted protein [Podarcis lilfordi]
MLWHEANGHDAGLMRDQGREDWDISFYIYKCNNSNNNNNSNVRYQFSWIPEAMDGLEPKGQSLPSLAVGKEPVGDDVFRIWMQMLMELLAQ